MSPILWSRSITGRVSVGQASSKMRVKRLSARLSPSWNLRWAGQSCGGGKIGSTQSLRQSHDDVLEEVLQEPGDDAAEQRAGGVEAGVGVGLDQPHPQLLIDHEVQPEQLEAVLPPWGQTGVGGAHAVAADGLHGGQEVVEVAAAAGGVQQVLVEVSVGQLVGALEAAVVGVGLLDGVVGEVREQVLGVPAAVLRRRRPQIPLPVPVPLHPPTHTAHHHEVPNVKLPLVIQQRSLNILLQNKGP